MRRRHLLTGTAFATALAGVVALQAPTASAGVPTASCSFTGGVLAVTDPDGGELLISRAGDTIFVSDPSSLSCGSPTVTTTNRIDVTATGTNDNYLRIHFSGGAYAPGLTDEGDGGSEIEFRITLGSHLTSGDAIELNQIPSASAGTAGVNLNPAAEAADEVDLTRPDDSAAPDDIESWIFTAGGGGMTLAANGDSGAGGNFPYPITSYGSSSPDTDTVIGGDADDDLHGGAGSDVLTGGLGRDILLGNEGIDKLKAKDGVKDTKINCGPGRNRRESARVDRKDPPAKSC